MIQEYIKPADGTIVRSEFIGGKFFYAVKVDSSDGFELCPADSCQIGDIPATNKFTIIDSLPSEQVDLYEQFLKEQEIDVAAIEFIFDANGEAYAYDVNTNTNYNADAEKIAEKYAMLKLANFLKAELEKR